MTKETIKLNQELNESIVAITDQFFNGPTRHLAFEKYLREYTTLILAQVDQLIEERMQGHIQASHNSVKNENAE